MSPHKTNEDRVVTLSSPLVEMEATASLVRKNLLKYIYKLS
jgi:hypothetical protein